MKRQTMEPADFLPVQNISTIQEALTPLGLAIYGYEDTLYTEGKSGINLRLVPLDGVRYSQVKPYDPRH